MRVRLGGRESVPRLAGTFRTMREARERRDWVLGELAARRNPFVMSDGRWSIPAVNEPVAARMLSETFEAWRRSRIDVDDGTLKTYRTSQHRIRAAVPDAEVDRVDVAWVAGLVATLHENGSARESIRKTRAHLAMALDFAGIAPNPARPSL